VDDDDETVEIPARRFTAWDLAAVVVDHIGSVFEDISVMMCLHSNWKVERQRIAQEMQESIERIVKE
jgi:hypothetical protein